MSPPKIPRVDPTGLPPIETICHIQNNLSPCSYAIPKDQVPHAYAGLRNDIQARLLNEDIKRIVQDCEAEYVPGPDNYDDRILHPFMLEAKDIHETLDDEKVRQVTSLIRNAMRLRQKYCAKSYQGYHPLLSRLLARDFGGVENLHQERQDVETENMVFSGKNGVIHIYENEAELTENNSIDLGKPTLKEFIEDFKYLCSIVSDMNVKIFCEQQMRAMSESYDKFKQEKGAEEAAEIIGSFRMSYDNAMKIETHVHAGAIITAYQLLEFFKKKLLINGNEVVTSDGKTLNQVFATALNKTEIKPEEITVEMLKTFADDGIFRKFDMFNLKGLPCGSEELKKVFLRVGSQYFGEILKNVIDELDKNPNLRYEIRITVSGSKPDELSTLAKWWYTHKLDDERVNWIVQIPRKFSTLQKKVKTFHQMMLNVFLEMFEASKNPESHGDLAKFLSRVVAVDLVDSEDVREYPIIEENGPTPEGWTDANNPSYMYYLYYVFMNISHLNQFRRWKDQNTFTLRLHCGEAGALHHLLCGFLLAESICHGLKLIKTPATMYFYFLGQIGIAMSPTSNNYLFEEYHKQPFRKYRELGLCITLSSDDPLIFFKENLPLLEEHNVCRKMFKITDSEMLELIRNGIIISGYPYAAKQEWAGIFDEYELKAASSSGQYLVPICRLNFRLEQLLNELGQVFSTNNA